MQKQLAAWFLIVALLYVMVGAAVPRLEPSPFWGTALIVSLDIVIGLGAAWLVSHLLTRRLRELATAASVVSRGDLTRRVAIEGNDETADLARSFTTMSASLLRIVVQVREVAEQVSLSARSLSTTADDMNATTDEIAATARAIAQGAHEQARQVESTSSVTRVLAESIELVSTRAAEVHQAARAACERTDDGVDDARRAADGIARLAEKTAAATSALDGFRLRADEIGSIVSSISSISQQTHLLAINAAIEAARAGEEGEGFAVIAEEVSRLSDNVRRFADRISGLSEEIMRGSQEVAEGIRESVGAADHVRVLVRRTASAFEEILEAVRRTVDRAAEISRLTTEQRDGAADVVSCLEEINGIADRHVRGIDEASLATQQQTATMREMALSAQSLAHASDQLETLISVFRLE